VDVEVTVTGYTVRQQYSSGCGSDIDGVDSETALLWWVWQ